MTRKVDDYSLPESKQLLIRKHAEESLRRSGALGCFPTPVERVLAEAKVIVAEEPALDEGFLTKLRRKAGDALRRAMTKVLGVLDVVGRVIYLDKTLFLVKQSFLKLHETAHAVLPWQRPLFVVAEDCSMTIAPEIAEEFEREANCFASDVLFQLNHFSNEANDHDPNILVPVHLAKKYGASIYASIRRYVIGSPRACMVLVLEPPQFISPRGFAAKFRRTVLSPEFRRIVGELSWPDDFGPDDEIGALIPVGRQRMSKPRELTLVNHSQVRHKCLAEAFTQKHQVFVLIHSVETLTRRVLQVS